MMSGAAAISAPPGSDILSGAKLLLLIPVLDFGGGETRIAVQAQLMQQRVAELRVCTFRKAGATAERLRAAGIYVDVLDVDPSIRNPRATKKVAKYLRQHRPDVLHACIGEANWHGLLAGAFSRVPVRIAEEVGIPTRSSLSGLAFPWIYRLAHRVVAVSKATCDFLAESDRVDPEKIRMVPNAAAPVYFDDPPSRLVPDGAPFRIVTVGRLDPIKNQALLIRAFARLCEQMPSVELVIVGEGPSRGALEELVKSLNLGDRVRLPGYRNDVRAVLAHADLFVLPSLSEGFGITLVEAMACEVPVLASSVGGAGEVIGELGSVLLSPHDEEAWTAALERIAAMDPAERRAMGRRARRLAIERFSPGTYIANLEAMYAEVLAEREVLAR